MRVLVTRPHISAARTIERLNAMGHEPVALPLSEAVHDRQAAVAALGQPHSALAITSAEAVRVLATPQIRPFIDPDTRIYAVGPATAEAARASGFRSVETGKGTGRDLADLIANAADERDLPILYLAGEPRSPAFEERLKERGIVIHTQVIYAMLPVDYLRVEIATLITEPSVDAVLLYSQETAMRLFALSTSVAGALADSRILCISEGTASAVPYALRNNVVIAKSPDEDALLALL